MSAQALEASKRYPLKGTGFGFCVRAARYQNQVQWSKPHHSFCHTGKNAGCPICPDFLRSLVALIHPMRLSLMKGAHADLSSTAWQEIGVKPFLA